MRPVNTLIRIFLVLICFAGCNRDDKADSPKNLLQQVKDGPQIDQSGAKPAEDEVPAAEVASFEIVLAERDSVNNEPPDELVYVILYDKDQNMVSAAGTLDMTYTVGGVEKKKQIQIVPGRFRDQIIPGEEESALTLMIDVLHAPPPGKIAVKARFDSRLEAETTLEDEPEETPAGE